jgi:peptidoglycan hydrolase CwlO-like protein
MLQNKQNILLVVIALLLCYNLFTTRGIKTDVKGYKDKIEAIQTKVDSAQVVNKQIDTKIDSVKQNVVSITKEIHEINNTITIVKKQTDEKVNTVNKFSNAELELFFTNRYNQGLHPN